MEIVFKLLSNKALLSGAAGWFAAQLLKIIIEAAEGKLTPDRISGAGGMPSTHSSTMAALTTAVFLCEGPDSSAFAISLFVSFIVMYDGMSVRYITGRQSSILNKMQKDEKLPEKMGHTLPETLAGCALGIIVGWLMCRIILP